MLLFLLSLLFFCGWPPKVEAQEDIAFCIPDQIVLWDPQPLEDHLHHCLTTNFYWHAQNRTILKPYVHAYIKAFEISQTADNDDDNLFYKKRTLMTTLRDTQLKVTHHMHAIYKCASIAHKMPTRLMSAYTNEAEMMASIGKLWSHHIKQDLRHCERVLFDVVKRQHFHLHGHIMHALHEYSEARDTVRIRREQFIDQSNIVKKERIHIMDYLSGKTDIPPGQNQTHIDYHTNGTAVTNVTQVINGTNVTNGTQVINGTAVTNVTQVINGTFVSSVAAVTNSTAVTNGSSVASVSDSSVLVSDSNSPSNSTTAATNSSAGRRRLL